MSNDAKAQADRMRECVKGCPFPRVTTEMNAGADLIERQQERIAELEKDAAFRLEAATRETEEARFYRYLRDEAGQLPDDYDGPMICSGLGDNFDYLRGEECDEEIRAAIEARKEIRR